MAATATKCALCDLVHAPGVVPANRCGIAEAASRGDIEAIKRARLNGVQWDSWT